MLEFNKVPTIKFELADNDDPDRYMLPKRVGTLWEDTPFSKLRQGDIVQLPETGFAPHYAYRLLTDPTKTRSYWFACDPLSVEEAAELAELPIVRFHLDRNDISRNKIELNGKILGGVTKFEVSIDAVTSQPQVTLTMLPAYIDGVINGDVVQQRTIFKDGAPIQADDSAVAAAHPLKSSVKEKSA